MQFRSVVYHALDTSTLHNERLAGILAPGVYGGYRIRRSASDPAYVDLTHGGDPSSVLLTVEGVRIEESGEIYGVAKIQPADASYARYDLIVAEYQWTPDNNVRQVYKVIRGPYQRSTSESPIRPQPQTIYQIPLAWIYVRPLTAISGTYRVEIRQDDIFPALKASEVSSPWGIASLKPELDETNRKRIYVNPGVFPDSFGGHAIVFDGAYSSEIDDSGMAVDETRYFLYGLSDDGEVSVAGEGTSLATVPDIGADILPICVAQAVKRSNGTTIDALHDIRFPFTRRYMLQDEENLYREYLRESVFDYGRIDLCDDLSIFDPDTLLPSVEGLTAEINRGDTSLTVTWDGVNPITGDVTVATDNVLDGTEINTVRHFLVVASSDVPGLVFDYSTVSASSGYTGSWYSLGSIIEVMGGPTSRLYLKFKIDNTQFSSAGSKKIFSFAVCMNLSYDMLNRTTLAGLGLDSLGYQIENLISNGDFFQWGRNDSKGDTPDVFARTKIDYTVKKDGLSSGENIFAADGWQFTRMDFDALNENISRVLWSRDVIGSADENTIDTALEWKGSAWSSTPPTGQVIENHLEFRTPILGHYVGQYVTLFADYKASHFGSFGIEVRLYERSSSGGFIIQHADRTGVLRTDGTLAIKTSAPINNRTIAVGFVLVFSQLNSPTTTHVKDVRAAIGRYEFLPFRKPQAADLLCRQYYERGTAFNASRLRAGDDLGIASQFGAPKLLGMSDGNVLKIGTIANRCVNAGAPTYASYTGGLTATVRATVDGLSVVDLDWEASVVYPEAEG